MGQIRQFLTKEYNISINVFSFPRKKNWVMMRFIGDEKYQDDP